MQMKIIIICILVVFTLPYCLVWQVFIGGAMKQQLMSLLSYFVTESSSPALAEVNTASIWAETGLIYYLLDTVKVSFDTDFGTSCYEQVPIAKLADLIDLISNESRPELALKHTAGLQSCITIRLCGVSWQKKQQQLRVKAIDNAAVLRLKLSGNCSSHAMFKLENGNTEGDLKPASSLNDELFHYYDVSVAQFIERLLQANSHLPEQLKRSMSVNAQNFTSPFTDIDKKCLSRFSQRLA